MHGVSDGQAVGLMVFVGVCGGRDYLERTRVYEVLHEHVPVGAAVVHGDCKGADKLADAWAVAFDRHPVRVPAVWRRAGDRYNVKAGPERNAVMAVMLSHLPGAFLIAFPGGSGTADMVRAAQEAGIRVLEIKP
jgi:hypothetical protein